MAEIFRDPSCIQWWLPNDEGLSPILRSIRAFADERNANPVSQQTESLREISAIFAKLRLKLTKLGLSFTALSVPAFDASRGAPRTQSCLAELVAQAWPIDQPAAVARFLSDLFPSLTYLYACCGSRISACVCACGPKAESAGEAVDRGPVFDA